MLKVRLRGDSVEHDGARREVGFYDDFDILADDGGALFSLRLRADGSLEIDSGGMGVVRHNGKALDCSFTIRPAGGRITVTRDEYAPHDA